MKLQRRAAARRFLTTDFTDRHGWKRNCHLCSYPCDPCHPWLWLVAACRAAFSAVEEIPIQSRRHSVVECFAGSRLPKQSSVETPQMVCRIGIRKLQRAGEIGHGGHWQPLLQIGGRLHLESHSLPRSNAKDTCSDRLKIFDHGFHGWTRMEKELPFRFLSV